jgi:predicted nucleotidyltransferase
LTNHAKWLKKDLDVLINSEREKNYQNIQNFEDQLKSELNKVKDEAYTKYETGTEKA